MRRLLTTMGHQWPPTIRRKHPPATNKSVSSACMLAGRARIQSQSFIFASLLVLARVVDGFSLVLHGRSTSPSLHVSVDANVEEFGSYRRDQQWQQRSKRWVLIVDDEEALRRAVGELLSDMGYQVTTCADGSTALLLAKSRLIDSSQQPSLPSVIVSDVRMPGMDGLTLLRTIRQDQQLARVPVVLLTAKGMNQDRIAGYQAGADGYVPKPFDPDELVAIVDGLIDRQDTVNGEDIRLEDLQRDLNEIKHLLLEKGGGGIGNGWVKKTDVFLAPDEREVLELLCSGLMNKEIADRTYLSTRRVEQLVTNLFRKTDTKNRTELVRWAVATGNVEV